MGGARKVGPGRRTGAGVLGAGVLGARMLGARMLGARMLGAVVLGTVAVAAGCTATPGRATTGGAAGAAPPRISGTADVAYAGSLQLLDDKTIGPAFTRATGAAYQGRGGGAVGLSHEIASGEIHPNVFESVGSAPITALEPRYTSWYLQLAASPIVVAYDPGGRFGAQLAAIAHRTRPLADLFRLLEQPGFLLGRTNPGTDPQGQAFVEMVELAQHALHLPAGTASKVLGPLDNPAQVFSETSLEARLEAGQLDAASAFLSQAVQLHLPYIALPSTIDFGDPALASTYAQASVTLHDGRVVHGTPLTVDVTTIGHHDPAAAAAFVAYLLSPAGRAAMGAGGYQLLTPTVVGTRSAVPGAVRHVLGR